MFRGAYFFVAICNRGNNLWRQPLFCSIRHAVRIKNSNSEIIIRGLDGFIFLYVFSQQEYIAHVT